MKKCPFCHYDPFEYVDIGVGMVPVAVSCCDLGIDLYRGGKKAVQALEFMQSPSPRKKARAMRIIREYGGH